MGTYYQLPEPGRLQVHCLPQASGCSLEQLGQALQQKKTPGPNLFVLPAISARIAAKDQLREISRQQKVAIFASQAGPDGGLQLVFCDPDSESGPQEYFSSALYQIVDWGPARLGLALAEDLNHPELALSMAKQGCDFALGTGDQVWQAPMESLAIKCLERVALACALPNMGFICLPPKSHNRWQESVAPAGGFCSMAVDTAKLRQKFFMDFVDYQRLFQASQDA